VDIFTALEMLVRTAEERSFSGAARQLGLTPAAVSKQIARLERELGVQLVVRTTRSLALTEPGRRLVSEAGIGLQHLQAALAATNQRERSLTGVLRVSLAPAFGRQYVLPVMPEFMAAHPGLRLDWQFDNRQVDLVAERFDAGIAGGVDLAGGLIARPLVPLHLVLVAAPSYLRRSRLQSPNTPDDLSRHEALVLRSQSTGRSRPWTLQRGKRKRLIDPNARFWMSDPEALSSAALAGLGIALAGLPHVRVYLERGELVRVLPDWWCDAGTISLYYPPSRFMPAKTRAFVEHLVSSFKGAELQSAFRADGRT
jgi:DNA-binding transcriptional LysR family regulator